MAGILGIGSALIGGAGALSNLFGGGGNANAANVQLPQGFQMPGMGQAAGGALGGIGGLQNPNSSVIPTYGQEFAQFYQNNPFIGNAVQGAQTAQNVGQGVGRNALGASNLMYGAGASLMPYTTAIGNTAFDPQNALYGRTLQQVQDQTRAGLEARGLDTTPYGAGVESDALRNFNIDWQNNLLGRQTQGASAITGLTGATGNAFGQGNQLGTSGFNTFVGAGNLPYQTYSGIGADQLGGLNQLLAANSQINQVPQQQIQDYLQYLQIGNQAGGVQNQLGQLGLNQAQLANNQQQQWGAQLGGSLAGLGGGLNTMYGAGNMGGFGAYQPTQSANYQPTQSANPFAMGFANPMQRA